MRIGSVVAAAIAARIAAGIGLMLALIAGPAAGAEITRAPAPKGSVTAKAETFARGLEHPWGLQILPDGRLLVTERPGRMRLIGKDGSLSKPIAGVPPVAARGQGGLLDVALAPRFAETGALYFTFSESRESGHNGTALATARLVETGGAARLDDVRVIFRQQPSWASTAHFGSRIAIARDGSLFVTLGERFVARDEAQNAATHLGKTVRLNADGTPHASNPRKPGWAPEVWSIGHRNPQSAAIHPETGKLWTVEHGARGDDEINIPEAGRNYGWPVITYGVDYSGAKIGVGTAKDGMEQPIYYWDPSIAPSGMAFYTADLVPEWKGSLFVGALAGQHLARLVLDGDKVVGEEKLLASFGERIRDVRQGPDGALWLLTDSPQGRVLRVTSGP